jgi:hypothetical protein
VTAGQSSGQTLAPAFQLTSYTAGGQLDSGFDGDGIARVEFPFVNQSYAGATGVAVAADGKVVAGGFAYSRPFATNDSAEYALAVLGPNGALELKATHGVGNANDFALGLALVPGAAILAGVSDSGGNADVGSAAKVLLADAAAPPLPADPPAATSTDLRLVKEPLIAGKDVAHLDRPHAWEVRVYNDGPAVAKDVVLTDTPPSWTETNLIQLGGEGVRIRRFTAERPDGDPSQSLPGRGAKQACTFAQLLKTSIVSFSGRGPLTCYIGELRPGQVAIISVEVSSREMGLHVNRASVTSSTPDSNPGNERDESEVTFVDHRSILNGRALREFERERRGTIAGTAGAGGAGARASQARPPQARIAKVEVAVARRTGSTCRWLRNARGRFTRGTCDAPVWLRAKGTARFSYRVIKRLPRGHYLVFSRATNRGGASEGRFTAERRNRKALRLR